MVTNCQFLATYWFSILNPRPLVLQYVVLVSVSISLLVDLYDYNSPLNGFCGMLCVPQCPSIAVLCFPFLIITFFSTLQLFSPIYDVLFTLLFSS